MKTRNLLQFLLVAATVLGGMAQAAPALRIVSPVEGTIVAPGSAVEVVVEVTEPDNIGEVLLAGPVFRGIGVSDPQPPAERLVFSVAIPADEPRGQNGCVALSKLKESGQQIRSNPLRFSVEDQQVAIGSLQLYPQSLTLKYPGSKGSFSVTARDLQGGRIKVEDSTYLRVTSSDEMIARAKPGAIFAVAKGRAVITVSYGGKSSAIAVNVLAGVPGDLDADGDVDSEDFDELNLTMDVSANGPEDARDLTHDGRIDQNDLAALVKLCTHTLCAITADGRYGRLPDTDPPQVRITTPADGAVVSGRVTITAEAQDNDKVLGVQFRVNDADLGAEVATSPFSVNWKPSAAGTYALTAIALDPTGNKGSAQPVNVSVGKATPFPSPTSAVCIGKGMRCSFNSQCCSARCSRGACR